MTETSKCHWGHPNLSLSRPLSWASDTAIHPPTGHQLVHIPLAVIQNIPNWAYLPAQTCLFPTSSISLKGTTSQNLESVLAFSLTRIQSTAPPSQHLTAHKGTHIFPCPSPNATTIMQGSSPLSGILCCPLQSMRVPASAPLRINSRLLKVVKKDWRNLNLSPCLLLTWHFYTLALLNVFTLNTICLLRSLKLSPLYLERSFPTSVFDWLTYLLSIS